MELDASKMLLMALVLLDFANEVLDDFRQKLYTKIPVNCQKKVNNESS